MTGVDYGDDWDYASSRLRETVVASKTGHPLFVYNVYDNLTAHCEDVLLGGQGVTLPLKDLDLSPVRLGYSNKDRCAVFTNRSPCRHYKQGLTSTTFRSYSVEGRRVSYNSVAMHKTIKGLYPNLEECVESVMTLEARSMAFSRNFAVRMKNEGLALYFQEHLVGLPKWNMEACNMNYGLISDFKYLEEALEEEVKGGK